MTTLIEHDPTVAGTLRGAVGEDVVLFDALDRLRDHLEQDPDEDVVVVGPSVDLTAALHLAEIMRVSRPSLGVVLVRRRVDTSVLADSLRAGVREVAEERDLAGLNAAVRRAREVARALRHQAGQPEAGPASRKGRLVTVFSAKGGCGKTTVSTNIATILAGMGRRVCLVDLDLAFGDVAIALQLMPSHTIADAVPLEATLDAEGVQGLLTTHSSGVKALVAPVQPDAKETISAALVGHLLEVLKAEFDVVVVDTPPAFDDQVLQAFDHTDVLILLATLDVPALKNLKLTLETLELLNFPRDRWQLVMNRADSKVGLSINDVEKALQVPIVGQIPSSRDVPASINRGVTIATDDPRHPVSQALRQLVEEHVLAGTPPISAHDGHGGEQRRSLLRRRSRA